MIAPKRISSNLFQPMITRVAKILAAGNQTSISKVGRVVLINSSILSTPIYYLSSYLIPNGILDLITKLSRGFPLG